jgi:hypothetical protein
VYKDGKVCISILHPPGEDEMSGEFASERWLPTQSVSSVLLSVISMLSDPNPSSPANVDASVRSPFLLSHYPPHLRHSQLPPGDVDEEAEGVRREGEEVG